jgi:ABC-type multidrug transport system fused ATPase/permease subunit
MSKIINRLPLALLVGFYAKLMLSPGLTWIDVGVLSVLSAASAFYEFRSTGKELTELRTSIAEINKRLDSAEKADAEVRSYVTSMKLSQQRTLTGR